MGYALTRCKHQLAPTNGNVMTYEPDPFHQIRPDDPIDEREPPPPPADQHNEVTYLGHMMKAGPYLAVGCLVIVVVILLCCGGLLVVNYAFGH